jgi:two-component system, LytTR family, response regulator
VTYRVVVVDDEPLARRGVRARLRSEPDFVVVGDCGSGEDAVEAIAAAAPDLVFLDIEMPGMGGFDVVSKVGIAMPPVIFLTAYAQYAVPAFDIAAVDYLLKPLDRDRLARALERARWTIQARKAHAAHASSDKPARSEPLERFWVRTRTGVVLVPVDEVDWIAAEGDYARLHAGSRSYLVPDSLASLEERLPPTFVRMHRSTIVNHTRVIEVRPHGAMDHQVRLKSGVELKLSRTYYRRLKSVVRSP